MQCSRRALGFAQPAATTGAAATQAVPKKKLPPLPAEVAERKRWNIGVKCDSPPFGYIDVQGKNAGFDVEIAKWFSRFAFGKSNRVTFTCVTTPAREPALTTGRVDLVIATFTYTADRDTRIDFSRAYYKATGRLLVRNDSPIKSTRRPRREDGRHDERLDLRPVGARTASRSTKLRRHRRVHRTRCSRSPGSGATR